MEFQPDPEALACHQWPRPDHDAGHTQGRAGLRLEGAAASVDRAAFVEVV